MISDSEGNSFENSGNSSGIGSPDSTDSNNGSDKAIEGLSKSHEDIREILSSIEDKEITASRTYLFICLLRSWNVLFLFHCYLIHEILQVLPSPLNF